MAINSDVKPKRMWAVWLLFFFQYAAIGIYYTFLNVYFRNSGLSGTSIGLLNMITAMVGVGSAMVWGYISDRTGKPKWLIAAGAAGSLAAAQFIPYVNGFWPFLLFGCLGSLMASAPGTLVDSTALVLLGKRREDYGRYRLGGSLGYIITAFSSGFIFQQIGLKVMFPAYGAVMACFAITALLIPPVGVHLGSRGTKEFSQMIRQPAWILFITVMFMCWIATNASMSFLSVSLSAMGASQSLIGVASTVQAVVELPFMFFSGTFLRRFGPVKLLIVAMVLMVLRFFLLGWMPSPVWAIAINMINGPAFVFFWNSAVTYANQLAPNGMAGTAQGLVISTTNLAGVVSSPLSGWLFDMLGPNGIFRVMAFLVLAALILFTIGNMIKRSTDKIEPI
jgi:MFS transporter, PPP family, 3-phenylpropionic acid transporter